GRDRRLAGIRDQIIRAQAEWERAQAVRQIVQQSQSYLDQRDFDKAIAVLESALKRYPGEAQLAQLMTAAHDALAAKGRDEAIETICRQTEAQIAKREFA